MRRIGIQENKEVIKVICLFLPYVDKNFESIQHSFAHWLKHQRAVAEIITKKAKIRPYSLFYYVDVK